MIVEVDGKRTKVRAIYFYESLLSGEHFCLLQAEEQAHAQQSQERSEPPDLEAKDAVLIIPRDTIAVGFARAEKDDQGRHQIDWISSGKSKGFDTLRTSFLAAAEDSKYEPRSRLEIQDADGRILTVATQRYIWHLADVFGTGRSSSMEDLSDILIVKRHDKQTGTRPEDKPLYPKGTEIEALTNRYRGIKIGQRGTVGSRFVVFPRTERHQGTAIEQDQIRDNPSDWKVL